MRVLSVQQPFAQLIVRGVKRWMPRSSGTPHRGTVAIYASAAVPSHAIFAELARDHPLAIQFATQRWHERQQVLGLPRSAVVGTVELVSVTPAVTDGFLWEFADAVEIEPVGGVRGQMRLWTLPDEIAGAVTRSEAAARAARPSSAMPEDTAAVDAHAEAVAEAEFWARQRERDRLAEASWAWLAQQKLAAEERPMPYFWRPSTERRVAREIARYMKEHQVRGAGGNAEVRVDHRIEYLAELFGERAWVPVVEFESVVREHLRRECRLPVLNPGEQRFVVDPYEGFFGDEELDAQPRFYECDNGAVVRTDFTALDQRHRRQRPVVEPEERAAPERRGRRRRDGSQ